MNSTKRGEHLQALIRALDGGSGGEGYLEILRTLEVPVAELEPHATWHPKHYTRNILAQRPGYELLLICFGPGQRTSIHDYDSAHAYVRPVLGEVVEERFRLDASGRPELVRTTSLHSGIISHLGGGDSIHRFENVGDGRAMTLNLYAPPLRKWRVYDERSGSSSTRPPGA